MKFSPLIDPRLIRLIDEIDDGSRSRASIWRELGRRARRRNLLQPSYESVRRLVNARRQIGLQPAGADRPTRRRSGRVADANTLLLALVAGDVVARRVADYRRRARDDLSRTRTRARA